MNGMPMPGGPIAAATAFMLMWVGMMVVMMLPVLAPVLWSYHRSRPAGVIGATAAVGLAYYAAWALFGLAAFGLTQAVPRFATLAIGGLLLLLGSFQFTPAKRRYLDRCRLRMGVSADESQSIRQGWGYGWRLGMDCVVCCLGFMLLLLAIGMSQPPAMILVGVAIAAERLAPRPWMVARCTGGLAVILGIVVVMNSTRL